MKNNLLKNILYTVTLIIQSIIIVGVFILQYLTNKKAGVLHHVYYRNYQFQNSIFSEINISIQKVGVIVFIVLLLLMLIYIINKKKSKFYIIQVLIGLLLSLLLYLVIISNYFISKVAYHYFIIAFALVLIIQIIVIIVSGILEK